MARKNTPPDSDTCRTCAYYHHERDNYGRCRSRRVKGKDGDYKLVKWWNTACPHYLPRGMAGGGCWD